MSALDNTSDRRGGLIFYDEGPTAPPAEEVRTRLATLFREAWGVDLDIAVHTPQGQILDTWTQTVFDKNNKLLFLVEQWNPETAEARYQDNICKIYFISRHPAVGTRTDVDMIGLPGTVCRKGDLLLDKLNRTHAFVDDYVIPTTGTTTGTVACTLPGPVTVTKDSIDRILSDINGLDVVNNPEAGVTGAYEESRQALEHRRYDSVAKNAHGNVASVSGAVGNLTDVTAVKIVENIGDWPEVMRGVPVPGHSMFISVLGGDEGEIAKTIHERRDGGCGLAGNTVTTVYLPTLAENEIEEVVVVYNRPRELRCRMRITIKSDEFSTPGDIDQLLAAEAIATWFGGRNIPRIKPGSDVLAADFYCPLNNIKAQYELVKIEVSRMERYNSTIPEEDFYFEMDGERYPKSTKMLVKQYPEYFSFTTNQGFVIDDSKVTPVGLTFTDYADFFNTYMDENPLLAEGDIEVVDLRATGGGTPVVPSEMYVHLDEEKGVIINCGGKPFTLYNNSQADITSEGDINIEAGATPPAEDGDGDET